jgi:hypothetical protein
MLVGFAVLATPSWAQEVYEPKDKEEVKKQEELEKEWLRIEEAKLKPGKSRVKVLVGWENGRVDTFKIRVRDRAVEIVEVEVHYAKGEKDIYEIEELIEAGGETGLFTFARSEKRYLRKMYIRFRFPDREGEDRDSGNWKQPAMIEIVGRRATS